MKSISVAQWAKTKEAKAYRCKCDILSPFLWYRDPRPSIFAQDYAFTGSASQAATAYVEAQRALGKEVGTIEGLSKKGAESILRFRDFSYYSRAKRSS